jgi:transposase
MSRLKKYIVNLSDEDQSKLNAIIRKKSASKTITRRCQILLDLNENNPSKLTHSQIAKSYGVSITTIHNILIDYSLNGLDSAVSYKRNPNSNARRKLDGRAEAKLIEIACGPAPEGHSRWTLRLLEEKSRVVLDEPVGKDAIREALKKTNFDLT